jgi:hypothetical protein
LETQTGKYQKGVEIQKQQKQSEIVDLTNKLQKT